MEERQLKFQLLLPTIGDSQFNDNLDNLTGRNSTFSFCLDNFVVLTTRFYNPRHFWRRVDDDRLTTAMRSVTAEVLHNNRKAVDLLLRRDPTKFFNRRWNRQQSILRQSPTSKVEASKQQGSSEDVWTTIDLLLRWSPIRQKSFTTTQEGGRLTTAPRSNQVLPTLINGRWSTHDEVQYRRWKFSTTFSRTQLPTSKLEKKSSFGNESFPSLSEEVDFQTSELREKFDDGVNFQLWNSMRSSV